MKLTSDAVEALMNECRGDGQTVDGVVHKFGFLPVKIAENKEKIRDLLAELPEQFDKGGGWSFLCACNDKNGEQWTGLHLVMEQLVCLGIAADLAEWQMKNMADILPGGVPYFRVKLEARAA